MIREIRDNSASGNCEYFYQNMAVLITGNGTIAFA